MFTNEHPEEREEIGDLYAGTMKHFKEFGSLGSAVIFKDESILFTLTPPGSQPELLTSNMEEAPTDLAQWFAEHNLLMEALHALTLSEQANDAG
jgi:hypothetical protein